MTETRTDVFEEAMNQWHDNFVSSLSDDGSLQDWTETLSDLRSRYAAAPAEVVKVPKQVAEAVEWFQQNDENLGTIFRNAYEDMDDDWDEVPQLCSAETWIIEHPNEFSKAWLEWPSVETEE